MCVIVWNVSFNVHRICLSFFLYLNSHSFDDDIIYYLKHVIEPPTLPKMKHRCDSDLIGMCPQLIYVLLHHTTFSMRNIEQPQPWNASDFRG